MWIEERINKDGKKIYKFNERYIDQRTLKRKKVSVSYPNKSRETQKIAFTALNDKIDELQNINTEFQKITFENVVNEWWPIYKKSVKKTTWVATDFHLKRAREFIDDDYIIRKIDTSEINNVLDNIIKNYDLSNKYMIMVKNSLSLVFKYAKRKGYINTNPVDEATIIFKKEKQPKKIKDKFLEDDEYNRIIEFTKKRNKRYYLLFQFLYLTGMRIGEALGLYTSDVIISDERSYISITGTLEFRDKKIEDFTKSESPKTNAGIRNVDLSDKAIEIVKELLELPPKSKFLFKTNKGTPFNPSAINAYLIYHKKDFKIDKKLSTHIFRHTHISKLAEIGVPLYVIQNRVGHENSKITESIYLHVTEKAKEDLLDKLNEL